MKIHYNEWKTLCDVDFDTLNGEIPETNQVVYCPMDKIYDFFRLIEGTSNKYVLVSANSDYCLTLQDKEPVNRDMNKYFNMVDVSDIGYNPVMLPSRCDVEHCRITDKYSIKMYSFTKRTFDTIPKNILHWFGTNLNVDDDRITHIPFGIPDWTFDKVEKTIKDKFSIYINMQNNTIERLTIKNAFRNYPDVIIEDNVSHDDYVKRLKECPFIFSLPGNGYDCFRTMEAIYCGSIPIIVNDIWAKAYEELPAIRVDSFFGVYDSLKDFWKNSGEKLDLAIDIPGCSMVEWANRVEAKRELLK